MNAFADWLFNVLFGWMGTAANSAWNAVVNSTGGMGSFFSQYWLGIVLLLIIGGTVLDYLVWFVRWRPYLVWRSWLTRHRRSRSLQQTAQDLEHTDMDPNTLNTIADWVATPQDAYPLDGLHAGALPYADDPQAAGYNARAYNPPAPPYPEQGEAMPPLMQQAPSQVWQPQPMDEQDVYQPAPLWGTPAPIPEEPPYAPPAYTAPVYPGQPYAPQQPLYAEDFEGDNLSLAPEPASAWPDFTRPQGEPVPGPAEGGRRRRSDRGGRMRSAKRLFNGLREHLQPEDDESMIDGLPSPVRQEDAFHEAVYPNSYRYQQPDYNHNNQQQP